MTESIKLICIEEPKDSDIKLGDIVWGNYDEEDKQGYTFYKVIEDSICDSYYSFWVEAKYFMPLANWREQQIDSILK